MNKFIRILLATLILSLPTFSFAITTQSNIRINKSYETNAFLMANLEMFLNLGLLSRKDFENLAPILTNTSTLTDKKVIKNEKK